MSDDMADEHKVATINRHKATFEANSRAYVQHVFDSCSGFNVQTVHIEYLVGIHGLRTATGAFLMMRNNDIRRIPLVD